ncbi:molybdate transport system permease protein [Flavimobilis soli]|uniref:Molybdenum transport system permease n=1 Tax=Flavimobilis soli TaxID=442709 RepID=A0A2A9EDZ8_9MICO|nr:ABC transporter permease [Flavimobilis soli]PFG36781.1 molybdate transport system permease protein [Flavimobilis soli]
MTAPTRSAATQRADVAARLPRWVLVPAAIGLLLVAVPLLGVVLRVDLARLPELVTTEASLDALGLSLRTSLATTALCVALGVPIALVLARGRARWLSLVRAVVLLPLVLPPVVGGLALLTAFGRRGLLGQHLDAWGVSIAFSTTAVVLAQTFIAMPFLVLTCEGALRTAGTRHEAIAATLGARPSRVLWRVTLPRLLPGLAAGAVLAFARALGEFGATLTFAGSLQGTTRTLPLEIYLRREADADAAIALAIVLMAVAAVLVVVAYGATDRRASRTTDRPASRTSREVAS